MGEENVRITKPGKFGHIASLGKDIPTSAVLPSESASRLQRSYVGFFPSFFGSGIPRVLPQPVQQAGPCLGAGIVRRHRYAPTVGNLTSIIAASVRKEKRKWSGRKNLAGAVRLGYSSPYNPVTCFRLLFRGGLDLPGRSRRPTPKETLACFVPCRVGSCARHRETVRNADLG